MGKTIKVFEHEYLEIDGVFFQKHHWNALANYNIKNDNKYFTLYPAGVKFKQYVGAIQASSLTIEILPKADKLDEDSADKNKWHNTLLQMLRECRYLKTEYPDFAHLNLHSNSILDEYLNIFLVEIENLLRQGLIKKYRKVESNQTALKGRLLFAKQISKNLVHKERFFVRHTIYDHNHLLHQIIFKALKLVIFIANNQIIKGKAQRILLAFPEMVDIDVNETTFSKIVLDRKSTPYKLALLISKMLLLEYRPDITGGVDHVLALMFDMNKLWEEYVYRELLKMENIGQTVSRQNIYDFWKPEKNNYSPKTLRPDLIIEKMPESVIVIDTKWKLVDDNYPSDDDLKQMFAYAHYIGSHFLVLLYPSTTKNISKGSYIQKHIINGIENNVLCFLFKIPLEWDSKKQFKGLCLKEEDFNLISTEAKS